MKGSVVATKLPKVGLLAGENWSYNLTGAVVSHVNPANGQVQDEVLLAGPSDVDRAVQSANNAFRSWRVMKPSERRDILGRWTALVKEHLPAHIELAAQEGGRPVSQGSDAHEWMAYYTGWVDKLDGEVISANPAAGINYAVPDPYGVVAVITPFNAPVEIAAMTAFPAIAAGNCVVLKPPEITPYTSVLFASLALEAGLPPGVLNVVVGDATAGNALVSHPGVSKISFTGSPATARRIMQAAVTGLTPLVLELGGKSANIVFEDADLEAAAAFSAMLSLVPGSGQACLLPTRLLVQQSVADRFTELLLATVQTFKVGQPLDQDTVMGPVISAASLSRILGIIDEARASNSGRMVAGGGRLGGELAAGYFLSPTVFTDVDTDSRLAREEIFGPVLAISTFSSESEAVAKANNTRFGLAAYLQTRDVSRAHRVANELEAGYVCVNGFNNLPPGAPFGGTKESGFGREGGLAGLKEFVRPKTVFVNLQES
jgi:aldehyde dehydrogenase (NAD+)